MLTELLLEMRDYEQNTVIQYQFSQAKN